MSIKFKGPLHIFKSIYNGDTPLEDIEKEQIQLKRDLGRFLYQSKEITKKVYNNILKSVKV